MSKNQIKFILSLASVIILLGILINPIRVPGNPVFAESSSSNQTVAEKSDSVETPEPVETPEAENEVENEQEVEQAHQEVENEVQRGSVDKIEVQISSENPGKGLVKLERTNGTTSEKTVSASQNASIVDVETQSGKVSVRIDKSGMVTLVNNGINIQTEFPVVIDPKTQTIAVKTPSGVTVINTLPSQSLNNIVGKDKPAVVQSAVLGAQNGETFYDISGTQQGKLFGFIPVSATIETKINTQSGEKISVSKPWYLNIFGFAYSI